MPEYLVFHPKHFSRAEGPWPQSLSAAERSQIYQRRSQAAEDRLDQLGIFRWYHDNVRRKKDPRAERKGVAYGFGVVPLDLSPAQLKQLRQRFSEVLYLPRKRLRIPRLVRLAGVTSTQPPPADFWHLGVINLLAARQNNQVGSGSGIRVTLIDSGVDAEHPEFAGKVIPSREFDPDTGADLGPSHGDTHGHGTHLAGLIVGKNAGVAPDVNLFDLKLLRNGSCTPHALLEALRFVVTTNTQILNLSLAADPARWAPDELVALRSLMAELMALNILPVCAAGNTAGVCATPGDVDAVMTVGASNRFFELWANSGSSVTGSGPFQTRQPDLVAPGQEVLSALPKSKWGCSNGTSQATALVAGIAALRLENRGGQSAVADLISDLNGRTLELQLSAADRPRQGRGLIRAV